MMESELKMEKLDHKYSYQMEEMGKLDLMRNDKKKELMQTQN